MCGDNGWKGGWTSIFLVFKEAMQEFKEFIGNLSEFIWPICLCDLEGGLFLYPLTCCPGKGVLSSIHWHNFNGENVSPAVGLLPCFPASHGSKINDWVVAHASYGGMLKRWFLGCWFLVNEEEIPFLGMALPFCSLPWKPQMHLGMFISDSRTRTGFQLGVIFRRNLVLRGGLDHSWKSGSIMALTRYFFGLQDNLLSFPRALMLTAIPVQK